MSYQETNQKMLMVLKQLKDYLIEPKQISLASILKFNQIPSEHAKFLIEKNILIKIKGGSRGIKSYQWNKAVEPTIELADELNQGYADLRSVQKQARSGQESAKLQEMAITLNEIKSLLITLNDIKELLEKVVSNTEPQLLNFATQVFAENGLTTK
jgi:hypothetical protein